VGPCLLSIALIVRNEETVLPRILRDIRHLSDDVVVVDTGSVDGTVELARRHGARVYHFVWEDNFAAARNASFDKCTGDWIMWLDADDRIPEPAQRRFVAARTELRETNADIVYVPYRVNYDDDGEASFRGANGRVRIARRSECFRWAGHIHETLRVADAPAIWLGDAWVEHRPLAASVSGKQTRDRRILEATLAKGDRNPSVLLHYGILLAHEGEHRAAWAILEECLVVCQQVHPRYVAMMMLGACAGELGDFRRRLEYLHEAVRLNPQRAEAFVEIGHVHESVGDWCGAKPFYRAAIGMSPPESGSYAAAAYSWAPLVGLARCAGETGETSDALSLLRRAAKIAPERAEKFQKLAEGVIAGGDSSNTRALELARGADSNPRSTNEPILASPTCA
jgi:glycosyltransferase involved in cell wall biosynthesis